MAKREFTDYSQIAAIPVRSQQDYLMKYTFRLGDRCWRFRREDLEYYLKYEVDDE